MELKLRAWDKRAMKMLEVKSLHLGTQRIIVGYSGGNYSIKKEDYDLMLFTGITDINGREIFQGDTCVASNHMGSPAGRKYQGTVEWNREACGFFFCGSPLWTWEGLEVIELMDTKKQDVI